MRDRFNLRVLYVPTAGEVAREVARIEPYPERVAATAPKGAFLVVHAAGVAPVAATILKQELLTIDADCVISPGVYLGDRDQATDTMIMATERQYHSLIARLRQFPFEDLQELATEIELLLTNYRGPPKPMEIGGTGFRWGERTFVMGILNVTPDSFSGDGLLAATGEPVEVAVRQARAFWEAGADLLDVGGESTRPGAEQVAISEELARVMPVITALRDTVGLPISIDSYRHEVVAAALGAGAQLVNDVWGLRLPGGGWNSELARVVAANHVPIVLMHNRRAEPAAGAIGGHYRAVEYVDLVGDVLRDLRASIHFAEEHGIGREQMIVDPGIGFGKTPSQNIELLRQLSQFRSLGLPLLLGTSRKSFIGRALNAEPSDRVEGTGATVALGIQAGVDIVRVHDVGPMVRIARMTDVVVRPGAWERVTAASMPA